MNQEAVDFYRSEIEKRIILLPETWQNKFKWIYGQGLNNPTMEEVINNIEDDKLDIVLSQCKRSLEQCGVQL